MNEVDEQTPEPLLVVISGPSGVGKDTVVQRLKERGLPFHFVVTATTRARRENEVEGVDYFFLSEDEFLDLLERDELLEHAIVYDQRKGIPKEQVREALASGQDAVMRVDVQGARTIRGLAPEALLIFLTTTDEDELARRLKERKTDSESDLEVRLRTAREEYEYQEIFDYIVLNAESQLESAVDTILAIMEAERHRTLPRRVQL